MYKKANTESSGYGFIYHSSPTKIIYNLTQEEVTVSGLGSLYLMCPSKLLQVDTLLFWLQIISNALSSSFFWNIF